MPTLQPAVSFKNIDQTVLSTAIKMSESDSQVDHVSSPQRSPKRPADVLQPQFQPDYFSRLLDVIIAGALLVLLLPVMTLVAAIVYLVDPGPVIFAHQRIGRHGKTFPCLKFRTMYVGAEQRLTAILDSDPMLRRQWERDHKLAVDPRITKIGKFLRVTSLDELPQLFNVLVGDMSMVGPRPIVAGEINRYGRFIVFYYSVRPGLTGLWQVSGRSSTSYRRRVASDVLYAKTRSLRFDLKIMAATVPAVLAGQGSC